jgi:TonB family protein
MVSLVMIRRLTVAGGAVGIAICQTVGLAQRDMSQVLVPSQASRHRGETVTVCGNVAKVSCSSDGTRLTVQPLDSRRVFQFFVPRRDEDIAHQFDEQAVCATGRVDRVKEGDQIVVITPSSMTLDARVPSRPPRFGFDVHYGCEPEATFPTIKQSVRPDYPRAGTRATGGVVHAKAVINAEGTVDDVALLHGLNREANEATLEAIRKFQFNPGTLMGKPVRTVVTFEMSFSGR